MDVTHNRQPTPNVAGAMDVITEPFSPPSPTFHAREEYQQDTAIWPYFDDKDFSLFELAEYETTFDPGGSGMIWNSMAFNTSQQQNPDVLLNGRNVEWGSLGICIFHTRIDRLFDRDYVWAATQTMVSFGTLTLRATKVGKH